jgi:hypothetical protein
MIDYERLNLNDVIDSHPERDLLHSILIKEGVVARLLSDGCYVAGGFGRALMRGDSIGAYLGTQQREGLKGQVGDIDIFFSDLSKAEMYRDEFKSRYRSFGGNALEINCKSGRVQLVDSDNLISPIDEQLHRFDFTNACVAITRDHIFVNNRFKELEKDRLLDVKSNASPFMGSRIMKYFKHRGIAGVTPRSEPMITEWIIKALCEDFEKKLIGKIEVQGIGHNVRALLKEKSLTRPDDLLLVLGKFKDIEKPKYGPEREVDFALAQLKERGYEVSVPAA